MFARHGQQRFGIAVKLLLAVSGVHDSRQPEHHTLVAGGEVIQKFFGLLALLLHVVGNNRREVVVLVLFALPVGDIGLNTQQLVSTSRTASSVGIGMMSSEKNRLRLSSHSSATRLSLIYEA